MIASSKQASKPPPSTFKLLIISTEHSSSMILEKLFSFPWKKHKTLVKSNKKMYTNSASKSND